MLGDVLLERRVGTRARIAFPVCRHQPVMQRFVASRGRWLGEIDEVAVEINVVLVHAPQPCEAVRIQRMHEQRAPGRRQCLVQPVDEEADLTTRAAKALDAVRTGKHDERVRRTVGAEPRDVDAERLALRAEAFR